MAKAFVILAAGGLLAACAPYPPPAAPAPAPVPSPVALVPAPAPLLVDPARLQECRVIRVEIARQQRIAALSPVMETWLVDGAVRLSAYNAITGLRQRAAIEGCPV